MKKKERLDSPEDIKKFLELENELQKTKEAYGIEEKETLLQKFAGWYHNLLNSREKRLVSRKTYIWLAVLTGWMGGHRFYTHQYKTALIYLLTCWTGFPDLSSCLCRNEGVSYRVRLGASRSLAGLTFH